MAFLNEHFNRVRRTILEKGYEVRLAEHATVVGTARELVVSEFLRAALPNNVAYLSGEIIDSVGGRSGQTDILLVPAHAPRFVLGGNTGVVLADGLIACIEVKSSIAASSPNTDASLPKAMGTVRMVKNQQVRCTPWPWEARNGLGNIVRLNSIPASIVAFQGPEIESLLAALRLYADRYGQDSLPDSITVLDRDYTLIRENGWYFNNIAAEQLYRRIPDEGACLADLFNYLMKCVQAWTFRAPFTPLSDYLTDPPTAAT